jgi:hypothetical protein
VVYGEGRSIVFRPWLLYSSARARKSRREGALTCSHQFISRSPKGREEHPIEVTEPTAGMVMQNKSRKEREIGKDGGGKLRNLLLLLSAWL